MQHNRWKILDMTIQQIIELLRKFQRDSSRWIFSY
jgi:hypothetical protein